MNKKVGIIVGVLIAAIIGGAAVSKMGAKSANKEVTVEETVEITHRKGTTKVPKNPKKVVVLDYSSLDTMEVLGKEAIAIPKSGLPEYLEKYKDDKYEDLGSLKEVNLEKINELKPDLIIMEGRQEDSYEEFTKIAPTIMLGSDGTNHFESLKKNTEILGKVFDSEDTVTAKIEELTNRSNAIKEKAQNSDKNALVTMVYDGEVSAFGQGSRFTTIYDNFGFKQADPNISTQNHGQNVSYEYLLKTNPDYLFVIDKGLVAGKGQKPAKELIENDLTKKTNAYKDGNIVYLDTKAWYLGGPGIMATDKMITEMEQALNNVQ